MELSFVASPAHRAADLLAMLGHRRKDMIRLSVDVIRCSRCRGQWFRIRNNSNVTWQIGCRPDCSGGHLDKERSDKWIYPEGAFFPVDEERLDG